SICFARIPAERGVNPWTMSNYPNSTAQQIKRSPAANVENAHCAADCSASRRSTSQRMFGASTVIRGGAAGFTINLPIFAADISAYGLLKVSSTTGGFLQSQK